MSFTDFIRELELLRLKGFMFHHSARARGYVRKDGFSFITYNGKYGTGYVAHLPTRLVPTMSSRFHPIFYIIK